MINVIEDSRNEFKEILNDKLEKEVVSFLNTLGGNIFIGVNNDGKIIGINDNTDKIQLEIKDRIKNNISPTTLGLFDIDIKEYDDKKIIVVKVAGGTEKPYYLKKKGMTSEGCFVRVGSSTERMDASTIENHFAKRTRNSLKNIVSPKQQLTFSQLKIYYEEMGYTINDNFLNHLDLIMEDGKYNYIAYLLSDNNNISIKVATYSGNDAYDLVESEEYGFCSLIKSAKRVIEKFEMINRTYTKITSAERKELKMFDHIAVREAILNAFVHNCWELENPPKFEIFNDHISITSTGGLPNSISKEDFFKGYSFPKHPELMRVFRDVDLVEQLGTGIIRILKTYDKNVYEFSDNFIRVNFRFNNYDMLDNTDLNKAVHELNETQQRIIKLIEKNKKITQTEISEKLDINRTTVARNLALLKSVNIIKRVGSNKDGQWIILK